MLSFLELFIFSLIKCKFYLVARGHDDCNFDAGPCAYLTGNSGFRFELVGGFDPNRTPRTDATSGQGRFMFADSSLTVSIYLKIYNKNSGFIYADAATEADNVLGAVQIFSYTYVHTKMQLPLFTRHS